MDPSEVDTIVQRLVANPQDEEALAYAYQAGQADPQAYALLLERVGNESPEPANASHWLSEAANVWLTTLGDAHRAARVLMAAIDRDPTQQVAAERLAQLYRDKGDVKALAALLDRRIKALTPLLGSSPELRSEVAALNEELGRLWSEPPLSQPRKALEHFRRAYELDPQSAYAIFSARELLKSQGHYDEAWPLFEAELALEQDPQRKLALLRDEATTRRTAGDLQGASRALGRAREMDDQDPALQQEYASAVLDRVQGGENVPAGERQIATELLVGLAEVYDGEHGLAYSSGALDVDPGHERGMQLFSFYARTLQHEEDLPSRYVAYLQASPSGSMAAEARHYLAASYENAGQIDNAISVLEPLRDAGDADAIQKLGELGAMAQRSSQRPAARASGALGSAEPGAPGAPRVASAPAWNEAQDAGGQASEATASATAEPSGERLQGVLNAAQALAGKGKKADAYSLYKEILESDPAHPEALAWVEDYLRTKRDYAALRDVLLASVRAVGGARESLDARKEGLREVAGLCEGNLRDIDGAVSAYKQLLALDRSDDSARQALTRLLERTQRWDDLANLLEQEATTSGDLDQKIGLERKLAKLHEEKRNDLAAAAEAWARIANLVPDDDRAVSTASSLFEKAGQLDLAAAVVGEHAPTVEDPVARLQLFEHLGELREKLGDAAAAGDAFAEAAGLKKDAKLWESAERCHSAAEAWEKAANAAAQQAPYASEPLEEAKHCARAAGLFSRAGNVAESIARLERATELDPSSDDYATSLIDRYTEAGQDAKIAILLTGRSERVSETSHRVAIRKQAAVFYATRMGDDAAARGQWLKVLEDGEDHEAIEKLVDYAIAHDEHAEATTLLRRLQGIVVDKPEKARLALREAEQFADGLGDVDKAIECYEAILVDIDPTVRPALQAIADLQEARENFAGAANALERELLLVADAKDRAPIAGRLARLYDRTGEPDKAIVALDVVRQADPEDFDALERLCALCERTEQWGRVAELLAQRIEVEADEEESATMTLKLSTVLADKLNRGDEALAALAEPADHGYAGLREAYVALGDRLGWKGIVAAKLVEWWFEAAGGAERTAALRGAFDRFSEVGRDQEAVRVATEVVRAKAGDADLAKRLEQLALKTSDAEALQLAQDLLVRELSGVDRTTELVRQAEVRVQAGTPRVEAIQHAEAGLTGVSPEEAEPLLDRLAALAESPAEVVDLYERQVGRCKIPAQRTRALGRAAQVAAAREQSDRAHAFLELALSGVPSDETLQMLEDLAGETDGATGTERMRRALCQALATSGGSAHDGGRTRGNLLRRAATNAQRELHDTDQAFAWMGDALIAHVDPATLEALDLLAEQAGDLKRAEAALSHALGEVYDGPLVRQLLAHRAQLRLDRLSDPAGAAADLKKLHDLSPGDAAVLEQLSSLLTQLGDYRAMVQVYEDQILRGKDVGARAELARKVAQLWEEQLQDPREAADAWRRVLRMKAGDPAATAGLERAKSNMLRKPESAPKAAGTGKAAPAPQEARVTPVVAPPDATRKEVLGDTAQFVTALTADTNETPAEPGEAAGRDARTHVPLASETEPRTLAQLGVAPPLASSVDITQSDLIVDNPSADAGDALASTDEHAVLEFGENEKTEFRAFTPPTEGAEDDVIIVDDLAEDVEDDDPKSPGPQGR